MPRKSASAKSGPETAPTSTTTPPAVQQKGGATTASSRNDSAPTIIPTGSGTHPHDQDHDLLDYIPLPWDKWAKAWNKYAWFPGFMGKTIPGFATFIFLHSMILTFVTPFVRWATGVWREEVPSIWYLNKISAWIGAPLNLPGEGTTYKIDGKPFTDSNTETMDYTWIAHATAGLTWVVVSWLQIVVIPKFAPKWHKRTGPAAIMVCFIHLAMAANIVIHDQQKHQTLNKVALSSLIFITATYIAIGAYKAVRFLLSGRKDTQAGFDHKNRMFIGWLWSISGAGPIRMVGAIMEPLGIGPIRCQEAHHSLGTDCLWSYFIRMVMIATWNLIMTGAFVKIQQNVPLTKTWIKNIACHIVVCLSFGILSVLPNSDQFVNSWMGGADNPTSSVITYLLWVAQALQLTIFFPLLFVLLSFMGPGLLFAFVLSTYVL